MLLGVIILYVSLSVHMSRTICIYNCIRHTGELPLYIIRLSQTRLSGSLLVNACALIQTVSIWILINPLHDYQLIERGHAYDQSAGKRTVRSWAEESWGSALLQQPPLWVPGTPHDMRG